MEKLAAILLKDGHDITMFVPRTYEGPYTNTDLSKVNYIYFQPPDHVKSICKFDSLDDFLSASLTEILKTFYRGTYVYCESLVQNRRVLDKIKQQGYDLAIYDAVDQCSKILADYIDIPFIVFHTSGMESILPRNPAYLPSMMTSFTDDMNLYQRVINTMGYLVQKLIVHYTYNYYQELRVNNGMNASLSVYDSFNRASLRLILGEYGVDYVGPTRPNHVTVGGFIHPEPHSLPQGLKDFLDKADRGVVIVSFGSIAREFGNHWREIFAKALAMLPMQVIWRYDEEPPKALGNNTLLVDWFPQSDVLAHPNVKVFITHCGMNAAYEAAYTGVPVVAIPLFADQFFQASKLIKHVGMGEQLSIRTMTPQILHDAVINVYNNKQFAIRAKAISKIMLQRPIPQSQEIQRWVNYLIFHQGAFHLQSKEHDLTWYQYYLLDVVCILLILLAAVGFLLFHILSAIFRFFKSKLLQITKSVSTKPELKEELKESFLDDKTSAMSQQSKAARFLSKDLIPKAAATTRVGRDSNLT